MPGRRASPAKVNGRASERVSMVVYDNRRRDCPPPVCSRALRALFLVAVELSGAATAVAGYHRRSLVLTHTESVIDDAARRKLIRYPAAGDGI